MFILPSPYLSMCLIEISLFVRFSHLKAPYKECAFSIRAERRAERADNWMCAITIPLLLVFTSYSLSHVSAANPPSSPLSRSGSQGVTHHHSLFHWTLCRFPSEPQFHISSRKMPARTVAGSRWKNSGAPCHRQAYLQQNALKGEELAMRLLEPQISL